MSRAKRYSRLFALSICALVVASFALAGCGSSNKTKVYKIGVVVSLSGPNAPLGQSEQKSLNLVKANMEKAGGINGSKVEFIFEDDESDPSKANIAASKLIDQEGVCAIVGASGSGTTLAIAPAAESKKIPVVCMAAGTKLTQPPRKYLFSVAPSDALVIQRVLMFMKDDIKVQQVAILHDSNAYGTGGADEFTAKAPDYGISVVGNESYGSADTDMTPQLTKIAQTNAQAILVWGTNPGPASIAKNMQQLNITLPFIGSSGIANKKFIELAGTAANGVVFPASRILLPSTIPSGSDWAQAVSDFTKQYKGTYKMDPDTFAAHGWDAGNIVVNAIKKVGSDPLKIQEQVQKLTKYAGADGVFNYSASNHSGLKVDALVMVKIENGQWVEDVSAAAKSK